MCLNDTGKRPEQTDAACRRQYSTAFGAGQAERAEGMEGVLMEAQGACKQATAQRNSVI